MNWLKKFIYRHRYMRRDSAGGWYWPLKDGRRLYPWCDRYADMIAADGKLLQENLGKDEVAKILAAE